MTVKQSENGKWFTQFRCKDKFGNEVHKCKRGFDTAEEAQAWEDDFIASAGCTMAMTFGEFYKVYAADMQPRLREHTWQQKQYTINSKILPYFQNIPMCDIKSLDIVRWQNSLMKPELNGGKGYSPTYLRTLNNQLTAILNHAAKYYGLHPNPAVRTVKMGTKEASEMSFWTKDEYLKFSDAMMDRPRDFVIFEILYWTGIREGELLALDADSFDWRRNTMRIDKSYQRLNGRDVVTDPKTPKSVRTIKLSKFLAETIKDYLDKHPDIKPGDRMFPVSKHALARAMDYGCKQSGVKKIRIHDLRHSHVSLLINMGFTALAIADRMGHEAMDITYRYAHLFPSVQDNMANELDNERGGLQCRVRTTDASEPFQRLSE